MKKTRFAYFIIVMSLLAFGCQRIGEVEMPEPEAVGPRIITAVLESEPATRTHLSTPDAQGIYYPYWSENDDIALYVDGINVADKYKLVSGAGTTKGEFSGTAYGTRMVALYPYEDKTDAGLKDDALHLELPSVQAYREGGFAEGMYPMVAIGSPDGLTFKNLCAVLKVSMTGTVAVKSIRFSANDSWMPVSGRASLRTDFKDMPELVMDDDGANEVTLQCDYVPLDPSTATEFFIVIPPGTYRGGISVEINTFNGTVTRSTDADIVFERSQVRSIPTFECVADGEITPDDIPFNQIWYSTWNNQVFRPYGDFDRQIVSNTYVDGKGVIVFDGPVTKIGDSAFSSSYITDIALPNSIESIGKYAFRRSGITSFHTPDNLESVDNEAFRYCDLTRIHGSLASSDEKALILRDGNMVAYAVAGLDADLVIPEGTKTLSPYIFEDCNIETIYFPESVEEVSDVSFLNCRMIRELKGNNPHIPDGKAFVNPTGMMVVWAGYGVTDYVLPESASCFSSYVFRNHPSLHSLTFPKLSFSSVILTNYFSGCDNLEFFYGEGTTEDHHCMNVWGNLLFAVASILPSDYTVPEVQGVYRTNGFLFEDNTTTERITMPDNISSIDYFFCRNMKKLRSVRMPANLSLLDDNAFMGVTTLDTIYFRGYTPPSYEEVGGYEGFGHEGLVICVPKGFEDVYKESPSWSKYAEYIVGYQYADLQDPDYYISKDYSRDGKVKQLQKAKKGQGIDIVLMGDAYSDRQIADGTYAAAMKKMMEAFFSEEPYTTCRELFNVYSVDVVSATEGYDHAGQALSTFFGEGTLVGGNDGKVIEYAQKVVSSDKMNSTVIIVAMNRDYYAGTCYMYYPSVGDYGDGLSVAYFPTSSDEDVFKGVVRHEAGGHGFAKLGDEYAYENQGAVPQDEIDNANKNVPFGWWKNVDFTGDPAKVKWAKFLSDSRYQNDGLGCFEGAYTYWTGAWRPTENSIMRYNTDGFNAPSREAIWYRIHKLAYGENWEYNYEDFVAYDAVNRKTSASAPVRRNYVERRMEPTHAPVVVGRRWNDPAPKAEAPAFRNVLSFPERPEVHVLTRDDR